MLLGVLANKLLFLFIVPGSAPRNLKVGNKTSTSIYVEWDPIPLEYQYGKILGYKVEITAEQQSRKRRKVTNYIYTKSRSLAFERLRKYNKYVISVSGLTRRGEGPARSLTVEVDGDGKKHVFKVNGLSPGISVVRIV